MIIRDGWASLFVSYGEPTFSPRLDCHILKTVTHCSPWQSHNCPWWLYNVLRCHTKEFYFSYRYSWYDIEDTCLTLQSSLQNTEGTFTLRNKQPLRLIAHLWRGLVVLPISMCTLPQSCKAWYLSPIMLRSIYPLICWILCSSPSERSTQCYNVNVLLWSNRAVHSYITSVLYDVYYCVIALKGSGSPSPRLPQPFNDISHHIIIFTSTHLGWLHL